MIAQRFDVVSAMTADEARSAVMAINQHMNSARAILLDLYERRGWVALGYMSWRECVAAEFDQSQRALYYVLQAAQVERNIQPVLQDFAKTHIPDSQLRLLATLTPMEQPIAWDEAMSRSDGMPTAPIIQQVVTEMIAPVIPYNTPTDPPVERAEPVSERKPRFNEGMKSSDSPEWYTPSLIIDRVIDLFGAIDLDPCSNSKTAPNVPAGAHYTIEDNGLAQPWSGRVYMNPPYGDVIGAWVDRLIGAYASDEIDAAIALLPVRTDTAWSQPLFHYPICFVRGRLRFSNASQAAPFPSAVVYLGPDNQSFHRCFHSIGSIMVPFH